MRTALSPSRLLLAGVLLLLAVFVALLEIRSNDYLLVPDEAHPVAPLVTVQGGHDPRGPSGIYFVDVVEQRATLLEKLIPAVREQGSSLVPASIVIPSGANDEAARRLADQMMQNSQHFAAAVALRSLGYKVVARPKGVQVDAVEPTSDAHDKIVPSDVIVAVDGQPTLTPLRLVQIVRSHRIGQVVSVEVRSGGRTRTVSIRLTRAGTVGPARRLAAIGLSAVEQAAEVKLPVKVRIDAGNVGGPSAGLAFALEVAAELGKNVTRGYRVAVTGAIELDGTVDPIGGVKQKTYGARQAHADVFLVPAAGDNAREARRWAHGLKIIPVRSFQQALRALATLPSKR